ncbi:C40 family peptidase [Olivibacter sp. SDN3]|uniref:C40 family peptidase n=1 Tax=Olivibacter sp. SDN3 TaxID=2764720 RepID=UPI001651922D|nr:NlpC/P60 family protein [Olivibacter sp. SDN3]QNL48320.1 C40 family peptidase [Olivibacter sp. SDN3]
MEFVLDSLKERRSLDRRTTVFNLREDTLGNLVLETTDKTIAMDLYHYYDKKEAYLPLKINLLPDTSIKDTLGLVNVSVGNIRSLPKNTAEMATQALLGWELDILKKRDGYYLVRTPDKYISWLDVSAVSIKNAMEIKQWNSKRLICVADYDHVYSAPDDEALRVSDLVMGNILHYVEEDGSYYRVGFPDGRTGYVKKQSMLDYDEWKQAGEVTAENILQVAKRMMGVPYLWGGTSIKGVDCSGFTKIAYFMNGLVIPRDASQQVMVGNEVAILSGGKLDTAMALKNLRAGDLLFFASGKDRNADARITHVALYMGDGEFIHAAGKVRINSMLNNAENYDDFQTRTLVAARRYIGYVGTEGIQKL